MRSSRRIAVSPAGGRAGGWALLSALLAALLVGLSATGAQLLARIEREREREDQLLRAGGEILDALASYRSSPFATEPELPRQLADLLEDRRGPRVLRHLRRIPVDPFTGEADWTLIRAGDRIAGVQSRARRVPLRRHAFPLRFASFADARTLADWRFLITGPADATPAAGPVAQRPAGAPAGPTFSSTNPFPAPPGAQPLFNILEPRTR